MNIFDVINEMKEKKLHPLVEASHNEVMFGLALRNPNFEPESYKQTRRREIEKLEEVANVIKDNVWQPLVRDIWSLSKEIDSGEINPDEKMQPYSDTGQHVGRIAYFYPGRFSVYRDIFMGLDISHRLDFRIPLEELQRRGVSLEILKKCSRGVNYGTFSDLVQGWKE